MSEVEARVRTLLLIVGGFFLFFLLLLSTQRSDIAAVARISLIFIGIWLLVAVGNLWYGVTQAGNALADELPIAALVFLPPALPAAIVWFRARRA